MHVSISLRPFRRLRLRTPPPCEPDSEQSSPELDSSHVFHIAPRKTGSREHLVRVPASGKNARATSARFTENTRITFTLDEAPRVDRTSKKHAEPAVVSDASDPSAKSTLIRRVTSKLTISIPSISNTQALRSRPSTRTLPAGMTSPRQASRSSMAASPTLPNSFVSKEHREAALRERGLLPPRKDFSVQEREADKRLGSVPSPVSATSDGLSEAERFKTHWLASNRTSVSSDSECGPTPPPYVHGVGARPRSMLASPSSPVPPLDADVLHPSNDAKVDLLLTGRPSFCSSVPPLSTSSHLEVLHEEPTEQPPPPLSPVRVPIIVSSPLESVHSPVLAESPTSYTFSSHCAGSTLESQSQSDHPCGREAVRLSASRRRTSDSGDRGRKLIGTSLARGTRSLSNLRRSVTESLRLPSSSVHSAADLHHAPPPVQAPRAAISPTMHNLASIVREARHIEDVESRRLSELAFLG